jgi:Domain of unknown function (DUF5753)
VLDVDPEQVQKLHELRRRADEPGWWQEYSDIVTEAVEMLVEIGEDATSARSYDNVFVQGLLQTQAYAEAVIGNGRLSSRRSMSTGWSSCACGGSNGSARTPSRAWQL